MLFISMDHRPAIVSPACESGAPNHDGMIGHTDTANSDGRGWGRAGARECARAYVRACVRA